jgi:hypothetical protein
MRPLPPLLPAARGSARLLLRAQGRRRRAGSRHLWPLLGLLRRPHREEAAEPCAAGLAHALLRHGGLQPRLQVLPEPRHLEVPRRRPPRPPRRPGGHRAGRAGGRLPLDILHLQRPRHLPGVCGGRRRRRPRPWPAQRRRDRGLYRARAPRRVLRRHGRRQYRPQGLRRRLLPAADGRLPRARSGDHRIRRPRDSLLGGADLPADSRPQRWRRGDRRHGALDRGEGGPRHAAPPHRLPPRLPADGPPPHAARNPARRPKPGLGRGPAPRLCRQHAPRRGAGHALFGLRRRGHRAGPGTP